MSIRNYLKYLLPTLILFITSCTSCDYASTVLHNSSVTSARSGGGFLQDLPPLLSDLIVDKLFGCKINDYICISNTKDSNGQSIAISNESRQLARSDKKGMIRNRAFETGIIYSVYKSIVSSFEYRVTYYLIFILYITILGLTYLMGISKLTMDKMIPIFFKIGIITAFTNPLVTGANGLPIGWVYYYNFIVSPSLYAMEQFAMYFVSVLFQWNIDDVQNGFLPLTVVLSFFGSAGFWIKITSLILTNILMGIPVFIMIMFIMVMYVLMVLYAVIAYISAISMLGLLFAIGPFFLVMSFFEKTKIFTIKWMGNIVSLTLQQYTIFVTVAIFGFIISQAIESMLAFELKCTPIITLNFGIPMPSWLRVICKIITFGQGCNSDWLFLIQQPIWSYYTAAIPDNSAFLTLFMYAVFLYMLVQLFGMTIEYSTSLAASLVPGSADSGKGAAKGLYDTVRKPVSENFHKGLTLYSQNAPLAVKNTALAPLMPINKKLTGNYTFGDSRETLGAKELGGKAIGGIKGLFSKKDSDEEGNEQGDNLKNDNQQTKPNSGGKEKAPNLNDKPNQ